MEIATRETMKTTPAAADPAIRGSCSLSSDLKSSESRKEEGRQTGRQLLRTTYVKLKEHNCVYLEVRNVCACDG